MSAPGSIANLGNGRKEKGTEKKKGKKRGKKGEIEKAVKEGSKRYCIICLVILLISYITLPRVLKLPGTPSDLENLFSLQLQNYWLL